MNPTPYEIGSLVIAVVTVVTVLIAVGRVQNRNDATAKTVEQIQRALYGDGDGKAGLVARVVAIETEQRTSLREFSEHMKADAAAFKELLAKVNDIADTLAELRGFLAREDTNPGRTR